MKGLLRLLCITLLGSAAEAAVPIVLQAETRASHLMEEALPRSVLEAETAERLGLRREPTYASQTPLYRRLLVGDPAEVFTVVVETGAEPRLWIDLNRNGDLTDDYVPSPHKEDSEVVWDVLVPAVAADGQRPLRPYRFRLLNGSTVDAQPRYGLSGKVELDGHTYRCLIQPAEVSGRGIVWGIDLTGDGRIDGNPLSGERFEGLTPFNVDGRTYQLAQQGAAWQVAESDAEAEPKRHIATGVTAPDFAYKTLDGAAGKLRPRQDWVLLDFWASWCRPCWDEIPHLQQLLAPQSKLPLTILGISMEDSGRDGRPANLLPEFVQRHRITWPVIYDYTNHSTSIAHLYNVEALPIYVLIDPRGVIRWIGKDEVVRHVRQQLTVAADSAETPAATPASSK